MKNTFNHDRLNEAGISSLITALIVAGISLAIIGGVREYLQRTNESENESFKSYQLELANETATGLMSQLYGNSTILRSGASFMKNTTFSGNPIETWKITGGKVEIYTCFQQTDNTKQKTFTNTDSSTVPPCRQETKARTVISFIKIIDASTIKGANSEDPYILAEGVTSFGGKSIKRRFRLRGAEATKVCNQLDSKNSLAACSVDHCKFMAPLRDVSNKIIYKAGSGGRNVEVEVNTKFSESMVLRGSPSQTAIAAVNAGDPAPVSTYNFYNNAYARGRINPFEKWQSIDPSYSDKSYIRANPDGSITLDVPNNTNGDVGRGVAKFDGFLRYDPATNLSHPEPWPDGEPYGKNAVNFKQACKRTIGTDAPDLCARINVNVKGTTYSYGARRRCYYYGPDHISDKFKSGLRDWEKMSSDAYEKFFDWQDATAEDKEEGEKIIADNRTLWKDPKPHHEIGPAPTYELHKWTPHVFNNIKVGTLEVKEVKKFSSGGDSKMKVRKKIYNWDTSCEFRKPDGVLDTMGKDFSICFYVTYNRIMDRFSCTREPSTWVCRNHDGCFVDDTPILMADGTVKAIQNVREGDLVYNPVLKKGVLVSRMIVGEEKGELYKISYVYGTKTDSITATHNHPFVTRTGIVTASELSIGQHIVDRDLQDKEIINIEKVKSKEPKMVWNILLESDGGGLGSSYAHHSFVAGGLMSGDYYVQQTAGFAKGEYEELSRFLSAKAAQGDLKSH